MYPRMETVMDNELVLKEIQALVASQNSDVLKELRDSVSAIKQLADGLVRKDDPASTVSNWVGAHGTGGLFSGAGVRPDMHSTVPRPIGLSEVIPFIGSLYENERYEILTGQTATEGTRAVDICSEGPTPGKLKVTRQVIPFGTMKIDTSVERLVNFGRRVSYADLDRNVLNQNAIKSPLMPDILSTTNVNSDAGKLLYETGLAIEKSYALMDVRGVNGTVSNNADFNLWIDQFDGLDRWIRTGYADQPSGVLSPAADSIVITHNAPIGSNGTNGVSFVGNMVNAVRGVMQRSNIIGMGDFEFALVMHPNAAWAVYDAWACSYFTDKCNNGAVGVPIQRNATDITTFHDQMMNGAYLLIDGMRVPILFSSGMQWDGVSNNIFNTDFYTMPLRWRGRPLVYRQFFPLNNATANEWMASMPTERAKIINGGMYAVGMRTTNGFCSKLEIISRSRLILDTPFLAARVNDVQLTYGIQGFDAFPGMSNYRDGGQSTRYYTP